MKRIPVDDDDDDALFSLPSLSSFNYKPRHEREIPRRRPLFDSAGFVRQPNHRPVFRPFLRATIALQLLPHPSPPFLLLTRVSCLVAF